LLSVKEYDAELSPDENAALVKEAQPTSKSETTFMIAATAPAETNKELPKTAPNTNKTGTSTTTESAAAIIANFLLSPKEYKKGNVMFKEDVQVISAKAEPLPNTLSTVSLVTASTKSILMQESSEILDDDIVKIEMTSSIIQDANSADKGKVTDTTQLLQETDSSQSIKLHVMNVYQAEIRHLNEKVDNDSDSPAPCGACCTIS